MMLLKLRFALVLCSTVVRGLLGTPVRSLDINGYGTNDSNLPTLQPIQYTNTASLLRIAYYDEGPRDGQTVILMHRFPYDINSFAEVAPRLVEQGYRVVVPYLRGYGDTRFLNQSTPRSAEQAALGYDLLTLMDALGIAHAILVGFDCGTIPVNVVAALWPERCDGMVAVGSYLTQDRNTAWVPLDPDSEAARWAIYPGHLGQELAAEFSEAELNRILPALQNPDFINITVDFYRNRLLFAPGDPAYAQLADALYKQPSISVPSMTLDPEFSTTFPATNGSTTTKYFTDARVHHIVQGAGENIP
ncbi:hypothetical protein N8I77_005455 [Diaporthe amygdali]|uniref:AB hydrolase-1 domain-containing protein n=1 Tax=Phomopsis amygdali TaxID=1214568 RepID=A0AAD9SFQ5_PHOAM|nr:hypothetical protein N8I77_005455 [Diaporthe amygdali]